MFQIFERLRNYAASPGTGILLLNLGILLVFFYHPSPDHLEWVGWLAKGLVGLSMLASAMYLVQKQESGPAELYENDQLLFEDRGTRFLKFYQVALPVLILVLCGLILSTSFRNVLLADWFMAGAMLLAILVQVKLLWQDLYRKPFHLKLTELLISFNLNGYEEIYWEEVAEIDWDWKDMTFVLEDGSEHHLGYGKMVSDQQTFLAVVQERAEQYQILMEGEAEEMG
ncbi:MAG: hypothetical protein AAF399_23065 [Bacteroidota bacterium]